MKKIFGNIVNWIKNHLPSQRRLIQLYAALLHNAYLKGYITGDIFKGVSKSICMPGLNCYSCPGAIGSCPLGTLQNSLAEGKHNYILGILGLFGLMLGRTICGFLCPMGLLQELLYKIKTPKLRKSMATKVLSYLKYFLLAVMVIIIPIGFGVAQLFKAPKEEAPKEKPNLSDVEIDDVILSAIEKAREVNPVSKHFFSSLKKKTGLDRKAIEEKINQLNADGRIKKTVSFGEK